MASKPMELVEYNKHGLRILLPKCMKVESPPPEFHAHARNFPSIIVNFGTHYPPANFLNVIETYEGMMDDPDRPPSDGTPGLTTIRKGKTSVPFSGRERVTECRFAKNDPIAPTENPSFGWSVVYKPPNQRPFHVLIDDFCEFSADVEDLWKKVLASIRVDFAQIPTKLAPAPAKNFSVTLESNMFILAPEEFLPPELPFLAEGEIERGYSRGENFVCVAVKDVYGTECKGRISVAESAPDVSAAKHAFCVPIKVAATNGLFIHAVSGPVQPLKIKKGDYDVVIQLSPATKKGSDGRWKSELTFLPAGTIGENILK